MAYQLSGSFVWGTSERCSYTSTHTETGTRLDKGTNTADHTGSREAFLVDVRTTKAAETFAGTEKHRREFPSLAFLRVEHFHCPSGQ